MIDLYVLIQAYFSLLFKSIHYFDVLPVPFSSWPALSVQVTAQLWPHLCVAYFLCQQVTVVFLFVLTKQKFIVARHTQALTTDLSNQKFRFVFVTMATVFPDMTDYFFLKISQNLIKSICSMKGTIYCC